MYGLNANRTQRIVFTHKKKQTGYTAGGGNTRQTQNSILFSSVEIFQHISLPFCMFFLYGRFVSIFHQNLLFSANFDFKNANFSPKSHYRMDDCRIIETPR